MSSSQCNKGLVCSKIGYFTGVCLFDKGGICTNDNDCANLLHCQFDGTCGCDFLGSSLAAINGMSYIWEKNFLIIFKKDLHNAQSNMY